MIICAICTEPVTAAGQHATSWATADGWHRPVPTSLDALVTALGGTVR